MSCSSAAVSLGAATSAILLFDGLGLGAAAAAAATAAADDLAAAAATFLVADVPDELGSVLVLITRSVCFRPRSAFVLRSSLWPSLLMLL